MQTFGVLKKRFQRSGYTDPALFFEQELGYTEKVLRNLVPIAARVEPLLPLPLGIAREEPHPYQALGAPYGEHVPYCLRASVVGRLVRAQGELDRRRPGYRLQVFDAYRPLAVQAFMIEHETRKLARNRNLDWDQLTASAQGELRREVCCFWAAPNPDPTSPPPHSTGAALDLTLLDEEGHPLPMGTPIDHVGPESWPNFFAGQDKPVHDNRRLLHAVMSQAGFRRLPYEWWHFSYGDQWWALLEYLEGNAHTPRALYGRYP